MLANYPHRAGSQVTTVISQYGGTKHDVSMMLDSAPKYCRCVPGEQYMPGINFDSVRGTNLVNFVQENSPAHKHGVKAWNGSPV